MAVMTKIQVFGILVLIPADRLLIKLTIKIVEENIDNFNGITVDATDRGGSSVTYSPSLAYININNLTNLRSNKCTL